MIGQATLADELRKIATTWIWMVVFVIAALAIGLTPWEAVKHLLENQGVGDEGAALVGFVFGYTLPLATGFAIVAFLILTGIAWRFPLWVRCLAAAAILFFFGQVARVVGLGLPPGDLTPGPTTYPWLRPLFMVLGSYLTTYGLPLMFAALAIGVAAAIQAERLVHTMLGKS